LASAVQIEPVRSQSAFGRFAPEIELLLACAWPAPEREADLGAVLASSLDWNRVLDLADHHRLMPAVYSALRGRNDIPASIRSVLRARFEIHQRRVLRFTAELTHILRQFDEHAIPVLAHKGAALGQALYGDPAMRQFGDLDFLVRPDDVSRARSALQILGYGPRIRLSPRQEREYLCVGYEHVFGLNADRNLVEVQWQIVPRFYAINFDMEALFARSAELDLAGMPLRTLCPEDQMLVLCVHAAKHEWAHLGMLRDIATLARQALDWDWIEAEALRLGIARILAVSLWLAGNFSPFHVSAPSALRTRIGSVTEIAAAIQRDTVESTEGNTGSLRYFRAMMRLRERWQDRVRLAWRLAVTPSVGDWHAIRLPDSLFSLYRGVRLFRLLKRFCCART